MENKNEQISSWQNFSKNELLVTAIKGSMVSVKDLENLREFTRDRSFFIKKTEEDIDFKFDT